MKSIVSKFLFLFVAVFFCACIDDVETTVPSSEADFVKLAFATNTKRPNVDKAVFTLEENGKVITNVDSLPFGTKIDSLIPTFSFKSTSKLMFNNNNLTGNDTLNFTSSATLVNTAADQVATKTYTVKINVHQVQPEAYVWRKVSGDIYSGTINSQKATVLNDSVLYFLNDGTSTLVYNLKDGKTLNDFKSVNGLPSNVKLTDIVEFNKRLYLTQGSSTLYSSADGLAWSNSPLADYSFNSLLYVMNNKLWAIVQSNADATKHYFASSTDGVSWAVQLSQSVPEYFPLSDFAAVSFFSRVGTPKAIVVGGAGSNGKVTSWSTENGWYWVNYSSVNNSLDSLVNVASVIAYDNKLLLFGEGINVISKNHYRVSIDEGLSWSVPDSLNIIPTTDTIPENNYKIRHGQSVVVYKPYNSKDTNSDADLNKLRESNQIFIIGGQSTNASYSDVWTGKLNRLSFLKQ